MIRGSRGTALLAAQAGRIIDEAEILARTGHHLYLHTPASPARSLTKQTEEVLKITYLESSESIIGTEHLLLSILRGCISSHQQIQ
jgi:hypothetical protein